MLSLYHYNKHTITCIKRKETQKISGFKSGSLYHKCEGKDSVGPAIKFIIYPNPQWTH